VIEAAVLVGYGSAAGRARTFLGRAALRAGPLVVHRARWRVGARAGCRERVRAARL